MPKLPKLPTSKRQENAGVRLVRAAVEDDATGLGWIFRVKLETDIGIDAEMEMVTEDNEATGKLLSLQIKCGPRYLVEKTATGYTYRGDEEHLNYWLDHALPVLLILVDREAKLCHWVEVTAGAVQRTGKGWKIEVPFRNVIGAEQRYELAAIAARDQLGSVVAHAIVRWLYTRFFGRIYVLDMYEVHRDYHGWTDLACLDDDKMVGIHLFFDRYGSFDLESVRYILSLIPHNKSILPVHNLFLCFVSSSATALRFSSQINELLASKKCVQVYRFLLEDGTHLTEVINGNDLIDGYDRGEPLSFGRTLGQD